MQLHRVAPYQRSAFRAAALGVGMAALSAAAAAAADDRFPFLATPAPAAPAAASVAVDETTALAPIPFPRPAPSRSKLRASAATPAPAAAVPTRTAAAEETAPTQVAYAAVQTDAPSPLSWLLRTTTSEPAAAPDPSIPRPPAAIPDTASLPKLEPRYATRRVPIPPSELVVMIENKAIDHGVPLNLAHAVVRIESNYDPRLIGGSALGLMQIKYATARGLGFTGSPRDLLDPATNLEWGMRYLGQAYRLARGDLCGTVMRYQSGHRAMHMSPLSNAYCAKAKSLMASR